MAGALTPGVRRRRTALLLLAAGVSALHLVLAGRIGTQLAAWRSAAETPPRLQAAFVRELAPTAPPVAAPAPPIATPTPQRRRARRAAPPAAPASEVEAAQAAPPIAESAPQSAADAPATPEPASAAADLPAEAASMPTVAATPADGATSQPAGPAFDWPASTRLSYALHGYYRGEMHGSAQVEWLREGERYQVHLDVTVGLPFAPLFTRRMSSDGLIVADGLAPRRYDEETHRAFGSPRRATLRFEDGAVVMGDGRRLPSLPGVQDTASQFVQLTWMFTTQPHRLQRGHEVEMPLALPREVGRWTYDVIGEETVHAPFGAIEAVRLKPRRPARRDTLAVETWIAPSLQYLPVRIRIQQDDQTWIDLVIERPPLQAASEAAR